MQAIPFLIAVPWWFRLGAILDDPTIEPFLSRAATRELRTAIVGYAILTLVFVLAYLAMRRRSAGSTTFVVLALASLGVALGYIGHVLGTLSSPMVGGIIAAANAISILFAPRLAGVGIGIVLVAYFLPLVAVSSGTLDYAPLFVSDPVVDHVPSTSWLVSYALLASAIVVFPISIQMVVFARWRKKDELVHHLACFDALTGVANRRHFFDLAEHEADRAARFGASPGLVLVDVDHFKSVNDRYGHHVGDEALKHVARVLAESARKVDVVGRYGGEEFAILAPETGPDGLATLAERCREALESSPLVREGASPLTLTASFGIASFGGERDSIDDLVRRADEALYRAKRNGRNRVESAIVPERDRTRDPDETNQHPT